MRSSPKSSYPPERKSQLIQTFWSRATRRTCLVGYEDSRNKLSKSINRKHGGSAWNWSVGLFIFSIVPFACQITCSGYPDESDRLGNMTSLASLLSEFGKGALQNYFWNDDRREENAMDVKWRSTKNGVCLPGSSKECFMYIVYIAGQPDNRALWSMVDT